MSLTLDTQGGKQAILAPPIESAELVERARTLGHRFGGSASERDLNRRLPHEEMRELAASGILAARVPRQFGGLETSVLDLARIFVALAQGDPNIAQAIQPHTCGLEKIRLYGTPAQQRHFFGLVQQGHLITNASAERGGGFIGAIRTTLQPLGDGGEALRLDGTKHYATGSLFASHLYVLARRDHDGVQDEARGLAIVPVDREGIRVFDDWDGMGQRTTASGTAVFERVRVEPLEQFTLPASGSQRTHEGAFAQILHAAIDTGIALAALEDAARYGREKARPMPEARVERASDDPYVQHAVGEMAVLAHGAEALVERGARILDLAVVRWAAGEDADRALGEASIAVAEAKMAANEASLRVSEMLYRVGGASATVRPLNLDRHWRNARTHTTHDPVAYKAKAVGDFYLNDRLPPINTKI